MVAISPSQKQLVLSHPHSVRFNQVAFSYTSGFGFSFGYCVLLCGWQCILLY